MRDSEAGDLDIADLKRGTRGEEFERMVLAKKLEILYLRPLDLSIDETMVALRDAVRRIGAKRAVIDSLSGKDNSLLINSTKSLQTQSEDLSTRIGSLNARLDKEKERLLNQFYTLETTISKLKSSFDSISGALSGAVALSQSLSSSSSSSNSSGL